MTIITTFIWTYRSISLCSFRRQQLESNDWNKLEWIIISTFFVLVLNVFCFSFLFVPSFFVPYDGHSNYFLSILFDSNRLINILMGNVISLLKFRHRTLMVWKFPFLFFTFTFTFTIKKHTAHKRFNTGFVVYKCYHMKNTLDMEKLFWIYTTERRIKKCKWTKSDGWREKKGEHMRWFAHMRAGGHTLVVYFMW